MNESKKVYTENEIKERLCPVFRRYGVRRAVLFGSYGKGTADASSDIDILVDSGLRGLDFVDLIEDVRRATLKDIDLLDVTHVEKDSKVDQEIQKTGKVIYAK
jgi:predicted nucleotidyltransferase